MIANTAGHHLWETLHQQPRHQLRYPSEHVVRFLANNPGHGQAALDIGAGSGRHLDTLREYGYDTYGCDTTPTNDQIDHADAANLPYPDQAFKTVICYGVLYYLTPDQQAAAVGEIHRVLQPGGKAFVVMRTTRDWRYGRGRPSGHNRYLLDLPGQPEDGMTVSFLTRNDIAGYFQVFDEVSFRWTETSQDQGVDSDWLITATK